MKSEPLVTIIALGYNQAPYIVEALNSVFNQTYKNIQIIIADDASKDNSVEIISKIISDMNDILFIKNAENIGNCKTFNHALRYAEGKYIVDFALDDVLLPDMIEEEVKAFENLPDDYSIVSGDAELIDEKSNFIRHHHPRGKEGKLLTDVPQGEVYKDIVRKYFIAPPSVMVRKDILLKLGGYDETLAYEDFDIWVRASRISKFYYLDKVLVKKREVIGSISGKANLRKNKIIESTFRICEKINWLNRTEEEEDALAQRANYQLRQAFLVAHFEIVEKYAALLKSIGRYSLQAKFFAILARFNVDIFKLYSLYRKIRGI